MGKRGNVKAIRVHKAVAETFIPNPNNYPIVHHKDENKSNPDYTNLEWVTAQKNIKHHHDELKKETEYYNNRKLNMDDIEQIKIYVKQNMSYSKIAKMFNVSKTTIVNLINGRCYKECYQ